MSKPITWKLIEVKASELKINPLNPKKRDETGFLRLQKSLSKFGKVFDGIANKDLSLIDGHSRLELTDPEETVSVFVPSRQLTQKEYLEMNAVFDMAKAGETDMQILEEQFTDQFFSEWGIENPRKTEAVEDDYEIPDTIKTDIVLGDLFEIGPHRLLCGDSTDSDAVARLMDGEKADMVFTDPPYGVDYKGINNDDRAGLKDLLTAAFSNYKINSKSGGSVYCCHSDKCSDIFNEVFRCVCHFSCQIIWVKDTLVMSRGDYHSRHEPIFYGWFEGGSHKFEGDRKQTSVWEFDRPKRSEGHSTIKPVGLVAKAINNSSKGEDLILDLFLGSGTTTVAAHQLNRKCYGMELDPKYCQVIVDRMMNLDPTIEVKKNGTIYKPTV